MENLTVDRLKQVAKYHPTTGVFVRRTYGGGVKPGERMGSVDVNGYVIISIDDKTHKAHRLAWLYMYGEWPSKDIDHRDNCGDHNWIDNLRVATVSENKANSKVYKNNTSGFKGVRYYRWNGKWLARIGAGKKRIHLGYFSTREEAAEAYAIAAEKYHGEFARVK